jgi:hypothetical protein
MQARLHIERGMKSEALAALESSAAVLEPLLAEQPRMGQISWLLMMNYDVREKELRKAGEEEKANEVHKKKEALGKSLRDSGWPRDRGGPRGGGGARGGDGPRDGDGRREGPFSPGWPGGRDRRGSGGP